MWHNHPFSQRNKEQKTGGVGGGGGGGGVRQSLKKWGMQYRVSS